MLTDKEQEEIRRKLLGLEEEPPAGSWSKIATEIQPATPAGKTNWWLPVILLLLLIGTGVFYYSGSVTDVESAAVKGRQENIEKQGVAEEAVAATKIQSTESNDAGFLGNTAEQVPHRVTSTTKKVIVANSNGRSGIGDAVKNRRMKNASGKGNKINKPVAPTAFSRLNGEMNEATAGKESKASSPAIASDSADSDASAGIKLQTDNTTSGAEVMNKIQTPDSLSKASKSDSTARVESIVPELSEDKKTGGWYVGAAFATRYAFRSFEPSAADEIYITSLNKRKGIDPNRLGYEFGLNIGKSIKENVYLETSLTLIKLREQVAYSYTTGKVDTLLKTKTSDGSYLIKPVYVTGERELKSDFMYGGLRVGLTYFFLKRAQSRFNVTVSAGANLLVKGRTEEYLNGEYNETITFPSEENLLEQTNYNLLLGAGYNVSFYKKYELMVMPSLNYFLGSTYAKREPFGLKPYTMGITFQVRRNL